MNTSTQYIDAVKSKTGAASDYQLAKILGITQQAVSSLRVKRTFIGDETAIKVAELLEIDPGIVIAAVHAERAKSEAERNAWRSMFEKLGGVAAGLVIGLSAVSPSPAQAVEQANSVYYVKSRRRLNPNPFLQILTPFIPAL